MDLPFLFGRTVHTVAFTNRKADVERLSQNLKNHVNTILISPRRWGKSSLVQKVVNDLRSNKVRIVQLDLFSVRNEEEFYKLLASETIKATSNKLTEWIANGKNFCGTSHPRFRLAQTLFKILKSVLIEVRYNGTTKKFLI